MILEVSDGKKDVAAEFKRESVPLAGQALTSRDYLTRGKGIDLRLNVLRSPIAFSLLLN